jgi:hypothetical protein
MKQAELMTKLPTCAATTTSSLQAAALSFPYSAAQTRADVDGAAAHHLFELFNPR